MQKKQLQENFKEEQYYDSDEGEQIKQQVSVDDEVDPLDLYMMDVQQQYIQDLAKPVRQPQYEEVFENEDPVESQINSIKQKILQKHSKQKQQNNSDSGSIPCIDSDGELNVDELNNPKKKKIEALPGLDHARVKYEQFERNFYQEHEEISNLTQSQVDKLRREQQLIVKGSGIVRPIVSFGHMNVDQHLLDKIGAQDFTKPTAIQSQALPCLLNGRNIIGVAKTGSGKTAAYVWPMLIHVADQRAVDTKEGAIGLVLVPTRELGQQVYMETKKYGNIYNISVAALLGGENKHYQWKELRAGVDIIVATPGRLIEMIKKKATNMRRCTYVVVDEADSMFSMGFEQQIRSILGQIRLDRQISLFTATMKKKVRQLCLDLLNDPIIITVGDSQNQVNEDIKQTAVIVEDEQAKCKWLMTNLASFLARGKVLVFVGQIGQCEQLWNDIVVNLGMVALTLHGDKLQQERTQIINQFKTTHNLLIATDIASRGLDIKEIRTVINYQAPKDADAYIHRIGRTGRAGNTDGIAYSLVLKDDWKLAILLIKNMELAGQVIPAELDDIACLDSGFKMERMKKKMGFEFAKGKDASRMLQQALKRQQNTKAGLGFDESEPKKAKKVQTQELSKQDKYQMPVTLASQTQNIGQFKNRWQEVNPYENFSNYAASMSTDELDRDKVMKHYQAQMRDQFRSGFTSGVKTTTGKSEPIVKFVNNNNSNKK